VIASIDTEEPDIILDKASRIARIRETINLDHLDKKDADQIYAGKNIKNAFQKGPLLGQV
jgi:hypothetical protein